jgi:hypothetical protein
MWLSFPFTAKADQLSATRSTHVTSSPAHEPSPVPPVMSIHMSKAVLPLPVCSCPIAGTATISVTHTRTRERRATGLPPAAQRTVRRLVRHGLHLVERLAGNVGTCGAPRQVSSMSSNQALDGHYLRFCPCCVRACAAVCTILRSVTRRDAWGESERPYLCCPRAHPPRAHPPRKLLSQDGDQPTMTTSRAGSSLTWPLWVGLRVRGRAEVLGQGGSRHVTGLTPHTVADEGGRGDHADHHRRQHHGLHRAPAESTAEDRPAVSASAQATGSSAHRMVPHQYHPRSRKPGSGSLPAPATTHPSTILGASSSRNAAGASSSWAAWGISS